MKHKLDSARKELTLIADGDILSTNVETVRQEAFGLLESDLIRQAPWSALHLDLRAAKMIDSAGLNFIITLIKHARLRDAKVTSTVANPSVQRTFMFTRLDKQLELVPA